MRTDRNNMVYTDRYYSEGLLDNPRNTRSVIVGKNKRACRK